MDDRQPNLIETPTGWLAATRPGARFHVGVFGSDPTDARERFADALIAWERLAAQVAEDGGSAS